MEEQIITPQNPFAQNSWTDTIPEEKVVENQTQAAANTENKAAEASEEIVDNNTYLKNKWGWDNEEAADSEIKSLREKAEKGFEWKNDESKRLAEYINEDKSDDLYDFLQTKKKIEKLSTADVTDKNVAEELVKFGLKKDNPSLNEDEVNFLFEEKYSIPNKPTQGDLEDDTEYEERVKSWEKQASNVEKRLVIEAKLNQPKLAQLKAELVLPDIQKGKNQNASVQTQEELDRIDAIRVNFLSKLESDFKNFNGFEVKYKDEEGEVPISYVYPDEQKIALKEEIKDFNVDGFLDERWFKNGQPDVKQMMEDIALLKNRDAVFQKLVNETGAQIRKQYIGVKANVNVTGGKADGVKDNSAKNDQEKQIEFLWNQKY